ncbi:hypothetical protein NQ314_010287 [Rhamnusium bicolor]|uniref:Thioredoxin-like protein 1 n=1 Tax=Rhamnusium bicolor TaxID=1586634 RepID=A0AAV8XT28_9CUCU|nr:hypothetical protein NQ314_010287 [Rhamnusium bicolor]
MGSVRVINDEAHFQTELANAATRLVVADFTATWCGPCQRIAPIFQQLAVKYPRAVFLKIDVDHCQETAASQGVSAMPTFIFYRNKTKVDRLQGADATTLESKIQQYYGSEESEDAEGVAGHMDLQPFILKGQCECLNESDDHPFQELVPQELEGNPINLRFVKFQNIQNIQLFIKDNQSGGEVTQIDHLAIIGSPISTTNMGDFKRVIGKKGESH